MLGGYNNKHYDKWILRAIYHGADNATIKALNDWIIAQGHKDPWNFPALDGHLVHPCKQFDLMDDLGGVYLSLKEAEGNLGMDIRESTIPFDLDRALTQQEIDETFKYCTHDVDATLELLKLRADYLESKATVGALCKMDEPDALGLTNAKLTACYLGAEYNDRADEFEYDFPDNLMIDKYLDVVKFFSVIDPNYKAELNIDIAGVQHTVAWGGLHGALPNYHEAATNTRKIKHIDVTSYYPSLMIVNGYLSRSVPDPGEYAQVYEKRVEAKKAGDKATAGALKLILNTTYGAMKQGHTSENEKVRNALYDPKMANAVCISGQLYLIDLLEKLENIPTFRLIQSNTDGLIVSYDAEADSAIRAAVDDWETRTGFTMGIDGISKIIQKDVNNYVLLDESGEIEVKGGYVSNYKGGDFKNASLVVVARAIVQNLLYGIPIGETMTDCKRIQDFQIIAKAGHTYDKVVWVSNGKDVEVQNVNRVYASINKDSGSLYKVKLEKPEQKARRDKVANLPDHCCIDNAGQIGMPMIDIQFYTELAQKRINDYLGIEAEKPKKERKKRMATRKTEAAAPVENTEILEKQETNTQPTGMPSGLNAKLMALRAAMNGFAWEKDGVNRHQSYTYFSEKLYKSNFKKALASAGLDFKAQMLGYDFIPNATDKMSMVIGKFQFEIIDRESGERETFEAYGSGADNGDKGIYKAYTGALKYFLANNFLVAEGGDPESDEEETRDEKPKYTPPERREEIKDKIAKNDGPATEVQLEALAEGIAALEESGDTENAAAFSAMLEGELTAQEAEEALTTLSDLVGDAA